ncbi:MAG: NADH-quinone oxidoreductase subunit J [Terriglobia bacterium]
MTVLFYVAGAVAIFATLMTITRLKPVHALLYLVVSLIAVAVVFFTLGAPFVAALEVIIYAGAIVVLLVFVVMMLNLGHRTVEQESALLKPGMWVGPIILAIILIAEAVFLATRARGPMLGGVVVGPKQVGIALFGPYLLGVELASFLLLGALVGAYHLAVRKQGVVEEANGSHTHESRTDTGSDLVRAGVHRPPGSP